MATIKDLERILTAIPGVTEHTVSLIIGEMRRGLPGEKLYIPPPDRSKKAAIADAARKLPTGVVVERFGVSRQYVARVRMLAKKRN